MDAIARWRRQVLSLAEFDGGPVQAGGFWDEARSEWFNRFAGRSDRSATYRFIAPHVRGQVLESGPGPGAYTRHLVSAADRVVAVEPSPHMARLLRQNLQSPPNLVVVECAIEDYLPCLESYDLALAANVLETVERIDEVIGAVSAHSRVLSIVTWANAITPPWLLAVQRDLLGQAQPRPNAPDNQALLAVLDELGLTYEVHDPALPIHTFACMDDLVAWVEGFVGTDPAHREPLTHILAPFVSVKDGRLGLPRGQASIVVNVYRAGC